MGRQRHIKQTRNAGHRQIAQTCLEVTLDAIGRANDAVSLVLMIVETIEKGEPFEAEHLRTMRASMESARAGLASVRAAAHAMRTRI